MNKKGKTKTPKKPAKKRAVKKPTKAAVEELDTRQRKAAYVLAANGYKKGGTRTGAVTAAARQAGVSRSTVQKWVNKMGFLHAIEEVKAEQVSFFWQQLRKAAEKLNVTSIIYALKVLIPEQYDTDYRRQELANQGIQQAVAQLPAFNVIRASGPPPPPPPELLPFQPKDLH